MARKKDSDRHLGKRENIWFPESEHAKLIELTDLLKEPNKSVIIRTAVRNFYEWAKENYGNENH